MKETQMSLFKTVPKKSATKKYKKSIAKAHKKLSNRPSVRERQLSTKSAAKSLTKQKAKPETVLTEADKAYQQLSQADLISKCHIAKGGTPCQSIALDFITPRQINMSYGEIASDICERSQKTSPHCYYHFINGHFILLNGWLMRQIYRYRGDIK